MGQVYVDENSLNSIGNALRNKTNTNNHYYPNQMGPAIENLSTGPEITDISYLFYNGARARTESEMQTMINCITNNITDSRYAFANMRFTFNMPNLNISRVTNIAGMFSNISNDRNSYLVIPNFDTSNVRSMDYTFFGSMQYLDLTQISNWDISNVSSMNYTFAANFYTSGAPNRGVLLPNWNFSNVRYLIGLFSGCNAPDSNLKGDFNGIDISGAYSIQGMFENCNAFNTISNIVDSGSQPFPLGGFAASRIFQSCNAQVIKDIDFHRISTIQDTFNNTSANLFNIDLSGANDRQGAIIGSYQSTQLISNMNICNLPNAYALFGSRGSLRFVDNLFLNSTSTAYQLFYSCYNLTSVENIFAPNATNSYHMFSMCGNLHSLANVYLGNAYTYQMFYLCRNLTDIRDLYIYPTDVSSMFFGCENLENAPNINTDNAVSAYGMFTNCFKLKNVPNFNLPLANSLSSMFLRCYALENAPNLTLNNVSNIDYMFVECYNLVEVPTYNFSNVKSVRNAFSSCNNLSNASIQNIVNMALNSSLTIKNLSNYNSSSLLYGTKFNNSYYQNRWQELTDAGWTY